MMDVDAAFRVFLKVADTESFSSAAKQLGMGQPAVSKQVSALEDHLGARLLHRTTRSITLTDEGREFLGHARHAIAATDYALERVQRVKANPSGLLRLSCQTGFARMQVVPRLGKILELYPDIDIDLVLQDSWPNLVEQGIDLRIHIGEIEDETVITQLIGYSPIQLFGTPQYLAQHGTPLIPQDLFDHQIIRFTGYNRQHKWLFTKDGKQEALDIKGRVGLDNFDALREAVIHDVGITTGPQWMFKDELRDGRIIPLLPDYDMGKIALYAAYPSRRFVPLKVRMFIDYVRTEYRAMEAIYQTCCD
jgi:DNA-binding transcriptional LysR family regulator